MAGPLIKAILNPKETIAKMEAYEKNMNKAVDCTIADVKSRGPAWVAKGVTAYFGVKKAEINSGDLGTLRVSGNSLKDVTLMYRGRVLTPLHFGMTPKAKTGNSYILKANIIKGKKATLGRVKSLTKSQRKHRKKGDRNSPRSPYMLQSIKGARAIPFQRREQPGEMQYVLRTVSLPQMIQSRDGMLRPTVKKEFEEGIDKRWMHHLKRLEK